MRVISRIAHKCEMHQLQMSLMDVNLCAADGQTHTLPRFWDMEALVDDPRYGRVYSEEAFLSLFGGVIGNGAAGPSDS